MAFLLQTVGGGATFLRTPPQVGTQSHGCREGAYVSTQFKKSRVTPNKWMIKSFDHNTNKI